jgi:hypothetical protein
MSAGAVPSNEYLIETVVVGSTPALSVQFLDLAQYAGVYRHLQIVISARTNRSGAPDSPVGIQFNGVTSGYALHLLEGNGTNVISAALTSQSTGFLGSVNGSTAPAGAFGSIVTDILDFSSAAKNTTVRSLAGQSSAVPYVYLTSTLFNSTSPVTSIAINERTGASFVQGSRFSLYGVTA